MQCNSTIYCAIEYYSQTCDHYYRQYLFFEVSFFHGVMFHIITMNFNFLMPTNISAKLDWLMVIHRCWLRKIVFTLSAQKPRNASMPWKFPSQDKIVIKTFFLCVTSIYVNTFLHNIFLVYLYI